MLRWMLFANLAIIALVLIFGLAIQTDEIDKLRCNLSATRKMMSQYERALNRRQICDTMSKDWYESELAEMRSRISKLQYTVDHQKGVIASKNLEIIRLKARGGKV